MAPFTFPFTFREESYLAACTVTPGKVIIFSVTPLNDRFQELFGAPIFIKENETGVVTYNSTPIDHVDSSILASSIADGLSAFRNLNPKLDYYGRHKI